MTSVSDSIKWLGMSTGDGKIPLDTAASDSVRQATRWLGMNGPTSREEPEDNEDVEEAGSQEGSTMGRSEHGDDGDDAQEHGHGQETAHSTPSTTNAQPATKAAKDRQCPFCGQPFTSSSLGRHLDLYIKPRNPKPPDGIHDVDEIRKLRGGITRRQPRTSLKHSSGDSRQTSEKPRTWDAAGKREQEQTNATHATSSPSHKGGPSTEAVRMNTANWQATGVINNLPPRSGNTTPANAQAPRYSDGKNSAPSRPLPPPTLASETSNNDSMWRLHEAAEAGRAAELALREVLGSLEAARKRAHPPVLFDECDFFGLTFPGLCLAILPAPGTLFTHAPFPSPESWSLGPPGKAQKDSLTRKLTERVREKRLAAQARGDAEYGGPTAEITFKHNAHLDAAWEHWSATSAADRERQWSLEILRALAREKDARMLVKADLDKERQHSGHLETQFDRLARCQLPREWQLRPPTTVPIPPPVLRQADLSTSKIGVHASDYDPNAIISKWRGAVKAVSRAPRQQGSGTQLNQIYQINPSLNNPIPPDSSANNFEADLILNGAVFGGVNGPMSRDQSYYRRSNDAAEHSAAISYETPPQPGTILAGADEGGPPIEGDNDADGETEDRRDDFGNSVDRSALAKQRQFIDVGTGRSAFRSASSAGVYGSPSSIDTSGTKRAAPHGPDGGRGKVPKLLKQQQQSQSTPTTSDTGKVSPSTAALHEEFESHLLNKLARPSGKIGGGKKGLPAGAMAPDRIYGLLPYDRMPGEVDGGGQ